MDDQAMVDQVTIIIPALNEGKNILSAINNTLKALSEFNLSGEIIIVDDGSTDNTNLLVKDFIQGKDHFKLLAHESPKGIGASFWEGVENASGDAIVLIPGDNEVDPWEIFRYYNLLKHVDLVIPFVFNKEVRSIFRNALSYIYRTIINTTFLVNFNYTNGTILYRKSLLKELDFKSTGFFFQTDILVRIVKKGYLFAEVPYRLGIRKEGISKAISFPSLIQVMRGYLHLVREYYFTESMKVSKSFNVDSQTSIRKRIL
jgi:glycosyltransferase involved in cell wall biosynthesis